MMASWASEAWPGTETHTVILGEMLGPFWVTSLEIWGPPSPVTPGQSVALTWSALLGLSDPDLF